MWHRNWFFWMEKLQITAGEQRLILGLILINLLVTGFVLFGPSRTLYDESHYEPVIEEFKRLSGIDHNERSVLLARYYPPKQSAPNTGTFLEKLAALKARDGMGSFFHPSGPMLLVTDGTKNAMPLKADGAKKRTGVTATASATKKVSATTTSPESTNDDHTRAFVNIQTAGPDALIALPGIGPVTAERIIAYREENGLFQSPDDLLNVSGIGPVTLDRIREFIILDDPAKE